MKILLMIVILGSILLYLHPWTGQPRPLLIHRYRAKRIHSVSRGAYRQCNPVVALAPSGQYWLAFRETNVHYDSSGFLASAFRWHTRIQFATCSRWPLSPVQVTETLALDDLPVPFWAVKGWHDPRLTFHQNEAWMLMYHMVQRLRPSAQMYLVRLDLERRPLSLVPLTVTFEDPRLPQKNWNFFQYQDRMYVVTRVEPHQIASLDCVTGKVDLQWTSSHSLLKQWLTDHHYHLHGGTALIDWDEERLLGACHVKRKKWIVGQYQTILYWCSRKPPFQIEYLTEPFGFDLTQNQIKRVPSIQMATGLIRRDQEITLTLGVNDAEMWAVTWHWPDLFNWMITHPLFRSTGTLAIETSQENVISSRAD